MTSDYADMAQDHLATHAVAEIGRRRVETSQQPEPVRTKRESEKRRRRRPEAPEPDGQEHTIDLVA